MKIKLFVMDVDGTLTDGSLYFSNDGEAMKRFNVRDGYAIAHLLPEKGIIPVIITKRTSEIVIKRAADLGITELYQGVKDKKKTLISIAEKYSCSKDEIAYIGDDINDIECMEWAGFSACPGDADEDVLPLVDYVCKCFGGQGAVREFSKVVMERNSEN